MKHKIILAIIISVSVILGITSVWNDSPIVDEIPHIGAGYSYITKGDYRLNPEHPPLAKDMAGLGLKFLNLNQTVFSTASWVNNINDQWNFGRQLIYETGNDAIKLVRTAKLPMFFFFIFSAIIIYVWTNKIYGKNAALLATFLFSLSPTIMAHSRLVTTDIPALFGVLFSTYFFINYLKDRNKKNLILAFLSFGIAQLAKFSTFLLNPYFIVLAILFGIMDKSWRTTYRSVFASLLVIIFGYLLVVWPIYGLHVRNYPPIKQRMDTMYNIGNYSNKFLSNAVTYFSDKPYIRAMAQYGTGVLMVTQRSSGGNTTYFLGQVNHTGWKSYFPIVYFIKEPIPFWILTMIAIGFAVSQSKLFKKRGHKDERENNYSFDVWAMFIWLGIYWYSSLSSNLNIGIRHLIPTFGFVYILVSGQISKIWRKIKIHPATFRMSILYFLFFGILIWYAIENAIVYPYYLTYFNEFAGGSTGGYRYVVDSNLDWGQDLKRLSDWVNQNNISKINLDYFGWADPYYYLKDKYVWATAGQYNSPRDFLRTNPSGGYLAVSATFYMSSREYFDKNYNWLDKYTPTAVIGNSIFVWHFTP